MSTSPKSKKSKLTETSVLSELDPVKASIEQVNEKIKAELARTTRVVRNFPAAPFEEALEFAVQLFKFASGEAVRRLTLFDHLGKTPKVGQADKY